MFLAQFITQMSDAIIRLFAVMVFVVIDVIRSTKYDVIMDMSFINMLRLQNLQSDIHPNF